MTVELLNSLHCVVVPRSKPTFTEVQFRRGKIGLMEDEQTMETILRMLREMCADPDDAGLKKQPLPEDIERAKDEQTASL
jgi:hypothetical protein